MDSVGRPSLMLGSGKLKFELLAEIPTMGGRVKARLEGF
jgi:hypothetical protein